MTAIALVACVGATLFMVGLTWFVQVVHYPLFSEVGPESFGTYHDLHSIRTTWVVAVPMLVELISSLVLAAEPPDDLGTLTLIGAVLAVAIWGVTMAWAAPTHGTIGREGPTEALLNRLNRASWVRTWLWTAHGAVVLAIVAGVMELG